MRVIRGGWPISVGAVLVVFIAIGTIRSSDVASSSPFLTPVASEPAVDTALAELASLEVKGRAPKTGYDREEQFGRAWIDVDRNGCDTRFPAWFDPVEDEPRQRS